jgi:hypothetical protein
MRGVSLSIAGIFACVIMTNAGAVSLSKNEPFIDARKRLIAQGWRPDPLSHARTGEYIGIERELVQDGFPEVDYCSGGRSFCVLQYLKGGACLRLYTQGEQVRRMRVESWTNDCRERFPDELQDALPNDVRYLLRWQQLCEDFGQCTGLQSYSRRIREAYKGNEEVTRHLEAAKAISESASASDANINDVIDQKNYPYDPAAIDSRKLPKLVPGLVAGSPFMLVRKKILRQGWHPINLQKTWKADESPGCILLDCELHRHGVVEVAGCPTDQPICIFYYRKGKAWLQVMATGETVKSLRVFYWASQAPQP